MERDKAIENFIANWNGEFPDYELKVSRLKEPHALMGALITLLDRIGIDSNLLSELPDDNTNKSVIYYHDLLPVINMTRVVNQLLSVMPQAPTVTVSHFLQPTPLQSHSMLMLLFNLMLFMEDKQRSIAPFLQELFDETEQMERLKDMKHKLLEMLNEQAQEKGKRVERLEKLNEETQQLEEEINEEKKAFNQEKVELDSILKEYRQMELTLDQKETQRESVQAEVAKKKDLRVYDAEDVTVQLEQATRRVQEIEEKDEVLRATLAQKEDSLKNLHYIKPNLDYANNLMHEITKISDSLMELECGDLESESKEGELNVLYTELGDVEAARRDLDAAIADQRARIMEADTRRQTEKNTSHSALREATERDRKKSEQCQKAVGTTEHIKKQTLQYEREKLEQMKELKNLYNTLVQQMASDEKILINLVIDVSGNVRIMKNKNVG